MAKTFHERQGEKQILVAEDNTDDYILLERAFRRTGLPHTLHRAVNGLEVIHYLQSRIPYGDRRLVPPPDLLLLDLKLPGMNGFEVLGWLRDSPWWSKLPVVVLAGSHLDRDRGQAAELGARSYYAKASGLKETQEMLLTICRDWLGSLQPA